MKNQTKIEEVTALDISLIDDFEGHPFIVKDDESMDELARSIEENGVLNPIIVRKKDDGRYEIIAGHRRKRACLLLGLKEISVIIRELSREEAIVEMVDSNFQREHILPSEKAKAYKMKMDSMKRKAGRPRKENVSPPGTRVRTDEIIAREVVESRNQIQRYIRLNELTPELLEFVDEGKIGLRPAVEISFLTEDEQRDLVDFIDAEDVFPSHAQNYEQLPADTPYTAGRVPAAGVRRSLARASPYRHQHEPYSAQGQHPRLCRRARVPCRG